MIKSDLSPGEKALTRRIAARAEEIARRPTSFVIDRTYNVGDGDRMTDEDALAKIDKARADLEAAYAKQKK